MSFGCLVPSPLRYVETAPKLHVVTASEWKIVVMFIGNSTEPFKVIRMTSEPVPLMTMAIGKQFYRIDDVEEHLDGNFSIYATAESL